MCSIVLEFSYNNEVVFLRERWYHENDGEYSLQSLWKRGLCRVTSSEDEVSLQHVAPMLVDSSSHKRVSSDQFVGLKVEVCVSITTAVMKNDS
jgi:hypothetical protein